MGTENLEVQIARMSERMAMVLEELQHAKDGRKHQYDKIEKVGQDVINLANRMASVENNLAKSAPTIEEFITIKHKVVGAGMAGKWIWAAGGFTLSALIFLREGFAKWF